MISIQEQMDDPAIQEAAEKIIDYVVEITKKYKDDSEYKQLTSDKILFLKERVSWIYLRMKWKSKF